ncbi:hypothetical protein ABZ769_36025 [Streptomyces olivoreticuli]
MTPPTVRTWARRGQTPVIRVRGRTTRCLSIAALACYKTGERPRLIYRPHRHNGRKGARKSFTWTDYRDLLIAAHRQLDAPIILVWDKCAVWRFVVSPTHSGGIWRNIPGLPDLPGGENRRGQQHVRKAVTVRRRPKRCAAKPARYGQSLIA